MIVLSDILPQIQLPNGALTDFELVALSTRIERVACRHGLPSPWPAATEIADGVEDYLRCEYPEPTIRLEEIAALTAKALFSLGFPDLARHFARQTMPDPVVIDLSHLAGLSGELGHLTFFPTLRRELETALGDRETGKGFAGQQPAIHLRGMRAAVKHLISAKRWSPRCEGLNAEIVETVQEILRQSGTTGARVAMTAN